VMGSVLWSIKMKIPIDHDVVNFQFNFQAIYFITDRA